MTTERLDELLRITGNIIPEAMEEHISDLEADEKELLPRETLLSVLAANHVPAEKQAALLEALEEANKVPELVELAHVMAKDAVRGLVRCHAVEFHQPRPEYAETGDISFDDYPWDMNFYCCQIFFLDRFYFIPYRWGGSPEAWRNTETGEVTALWHAGVRIRRDGQIDGVNGIHDPEAFTTVFRETNDTVTGNRVLPEGLVSPEVVTLDKKTWRKALGDDDYLLALHIPGGEGYTPERVKSSCEKALAFYDRYYPEYHYIGFWSESWLYDPGLREIVKPDRNIVRVQRQFYCYPVEEGDRMIKLEVLGDENADYRKLTPRNSLERGMFDVWARGDRFHTTGMFLLREEVPQIGKNPYET